MSNQKILPKNRQIVANNITVTHPNIAKNWDYERNYPLTLFSIILGGGTNSKLFRNVREKNSLCYYIYSTVNSIQVNGLNQLIYCNYVNSILKIFNNSEYMEDKKNYLLKELK